MKLSLENRVDNSIKNTSIGLIAQLIQLISTLICRVLLLRCLAQEYIGINGIITSVMGVLSVAELGIGSAMSYELYSALASDNKREQAALMHLYRRMYAVIGLVTAAIGLIVMPFVNGVIIKDNTVSESMYPVYLLYLFAEAVSYAFIYRETILYAAQQSYILTVIDVICGVLRNAVQCVFLVLTHSFLIYVLLQVSFRMLYNFIATAKANKLFPEALKASQVELLPEERQKNIFRNVKYIFIEKAATKILDSTDNIISGAMCGLAVTGANANYAMLITTIGTFTIKFQNALTAAIGNISVVETKEKQEEALYELYFIYYWIYLFCSVGFAFLIRDISHLVFGEAYVQSFEIGLAAAINFFQGGMLLAISTFRNTMGLFKYGRYAFLGTGICNVILSIILGRYFGLTGILIATFISRFITVDWYFPYVTFKHGFGQSIKRYVLYSARRWIEAAVIFAVTGLLCLLKDFSLGWNIVYRLVICLLVPNLMIVVLNFRSREFKNITGKIYNVLKQHLG